MVLALAMFIPALPAQANLALVEPGDDVVKLTDGRELTGKIVREKDGYVWLDMGVGQPLFLSPDKIKEIVRNSGAEAGEDPISLEAEEKAWVDDPNVTRAAIITAEGMVGMQMASKPLRDAIPMLKEEGVELVVFKVKSGGGFLLEIQPLSDVLHNEYKQNFQLVAWIDSAISAAAMTALTIDEIYFMPHGHFGAMTGWSGQLQAMSGRGLEDVYYKMEKISTRSQRAEYIPLIKAMQHNRMVSYDIDEATGEINFYETTAGEFVLNDGEHVLTLDSQQAEHCGFSQGTAATYEELQAILEQSVGEIEWVGEKVEGIPYPVSKAEMHQREYREEVDYQDARFQEVVVKYQMEIQNAQGVAVERRGGFLRRAEGYLARIKRMIKINPNFGIFTVNEEWIRQQEEIIRELRRG
ncbi:MAG: hypothetical protein ED559_01225 [Phycisphaera sp.]|nr:MAG: hypothetical protein ED559_01225 [Phycisphaera sp.]